MDARGGHGWLRRAPVAIAVAALLTCFSVSVSAEPKVVDDWYAALAAADRAGLERLLSDDARIKLTDLGVEQTKAEFVAALENWEQAVEGTTIRHRIESDNGQQATVLACYDFPENDLLLRETFRIEGGLIRESSQAFVSDNCDAY
jgi:protein-tyrosine phosphatase